MHWCRISSISSMSYLDLLDMWIFCLLVGWWGTNDFIFGKHIPTNALHLPGLDPNTELFHTAGLCTRSHSLAGKSSKLFRAFPFRSAQEPRNWLLSRWSLKNMISLKDEYILAKHVYPLALSERAKAIKAIQREHSSETSSELPPASRPGDVPYSCSNRRPAKEERREFENLLQSYICLDVISSRLASNFLSPQPVTCLFLRSLRVEIWRDSS